MFVFRGALLMNRDDPGQVFLLNLILKAVEPSLITITLKLNYFFLMPQGLQLQLPQQFDVQAF
jgi:hypothetical protein